MPGTPTGGDDFTTALIGSIEPINPSDYCSQFNIPGTVSVKPTTVISINGSVYWGIACMNYGDEPLFKRQHNYYAWIAKSLDPHGNRWNFSATPSDFFSGRLAAPMFIQYGQDNELAVDDYVYAHFPYAADEFTNGTAQSFWNNNDDVLLGRVPKHEILNRSRWQFYVGGGLGDDSDENDDTHWSHNHWDAVSIMHYPKMLGMNQVNYHPQSQRYVLANYGFVDFNGLPRPYHQTPMVVRHRSQLTLFEGPKPWGPFAVFHRDDDWKSPDGAAGGYCPVLPPKWVGNSSAWMVWAQCCALSSDENPHHYNFSVQQFHFTHTSHL